VTKKNADSRTFGVGKKKTNICKGRIVNDDRISRGSIRSDDDRVPTLRVISHRPILLLGHLDLLDNHLTALFSPPSQSQQALSILHTPTFLPFLQHTTSSLVT
jgi:hypothetical protein